MLKRTMTMSFKQLEIIIQPGLISAEQEGKNVWLTYANINTVIRFRSVTAATDFFNDNDFVPGSVILAVDYVSWEKNQS
jgi:hypothetical protein